MTAAAPPGVPARDLALAVGLALGNDFGFAWLGGRPGPAAAFGFFMFDYATRLAALWLVLRHAAARDRLLLALVAEGRRPLALMAGAAALTAAFLLAARAAPAAPVGWAPLFAYPPYPNAPTAALDATFGLALVAFHEEALFRGFLMDRFKRGLPQAIPGVLAAALVFAAIHWGAGPQAVLRAFAIGLVACAWRAGGGGLLALMLAHYIHDLRAFAG